MDQLDSTVLKILRFKEWCLVHERKFVTDRLTEQLMHMDEHIALSKEVADKLVTLLENHKLPLKASENGKKVLVVATTSDSRLAAAKDMANLVTQKFYYFYNSVKRYAQDAELFLVNEDPTEAQFSEIANICDRYDEIIYITFVRILSYKKGSGTVPESQVKLLNMLKDRNCSLTTVIAGNPYVAKKLPVTDNVLCTYCDNKYSLDTASDVLFGNKKAMGKLPVSI